MRKFHGFMALCAALFLLTAAAPPDTLYIVKPGDTMGSIAGQYKIGLKELRKNNPALRNPNRIEPGDTVRIPESAVLRVYEEDLYARINTARIGHGLPALTRDGKLDAAARLKTNDFIDRQYFARVSPVYGSPSDMLARLGVSYKTAGQNIAKRLQTPDTVLESWLASKGHRGNILCPDYTAVGVGAARNQNGVTYWAVVFAG